MSRVIVVGGGAAGLMAAYAAAKNGNEVTLIEKNDKLGKKIYITGKGRCNLTNDVPPNEVLQNVVHNAKFLTSAIYSFTPQDTKDFMENNGTHVKTERGNRVFPISDHASDVTKALQKACEKEGVSLHLNEKVVDIITLNSTMRGIITDKREYFCDALIICTGGLSYPSTGSTGDGYQFAKRTGHAITTLTPALTGLNVKGNACQKMQGLSLKNVTLTAVKKSNQKVIYNEMGEMLFTHYGISGPLVLTLSSLITRDNLKDIVLSIDFKPALKEDVLDERILRDFNEHKNKTILNGLSQLLPSKALPCVLEKAGINEMKSINVITKVERQRLVATLKNYSIEPISLRGYEEAIITSGGVDVKQINPKTMESKLVKGLYFCGEILDVDGYTGGFNLQIAFSTGYAAGNSIY